MSVSNYENFQNSNGNEITILEINFLLRVSVQRMMSEKLSKQMAIPIELIALLVGGSPILRR